MSACHQWKLASEELAKKLKAQQVRAVGMAMARQASVPWNQLCMMSAALHNE